MTMKLRKILTVFLILAVVLMNMPAMALTTYSINTLFETNKDNVSIYSEPYKDSQKLHTFNRAGSTVYVYEGVINDYGNLWYAVDGGYINSNHIDEHVHVAAACASNTSTRYEVCDENGHNKIYYEGDYICRCGEYVEDGQTTVEYELHSFSRDDICTVCGYQKEHVHVAVACASNSYTSYEVCDEYGHNKIYYEGDYICKCGAYVEDGQTIVEYESHSFSQDDICTVCGYQKEHVHVAAACASNSSIRYEVCDENGHNKIYYEGDYICKCGAYVEDGQTIVEYESHSFSQDDICTVCGYQKEHVHVAVACASNSRKYYEDISFDGHTVVTYEGDYICKCGAFVEEGKYERTFEPHSYDENNICTSCGYVKTHEHVAVACASNGGAWVKDINENTHTVVIYEGDYICSCGEFVRRGLETENIENHSFSNDVCSVCGYTRTHVHTGSSCRYGYVEYKDITATTHRVVGTTGETYCSCGYKISDSSPIDEVQKHNFENGKCIECGYESNFGDYVVSSSEQAVLGDFSDESSFGGLVLEVVVGEIPIVGTIADIRDFAGSIINYKSPADVALNAIGLIPLVGALKFSDEVYDVTKNSDEIIDVVDTTTDGFRYVDKASDQIEEFSSYGKFKNEFGRAGDNMQWHHIVEQSQISKSGFSSSQINSTYNIISLDVETHRKVTAFYNSKIEGLNITVRDWLAAQNMSYEEQYNYGLKVLERFGVKVR